MRVMVMIKGTGADEAKIAPTTEMLAAMGAYNEELVKAGIMLDGQGLKPSAEGVQVVFEAGDTSVVDGPFTESKEIIAGFWLIQVKSKQEAIEWARRVPFVDGEIEIRQVFELEDFGESEAIEHHARLRDQLQK